MLIQHGDEIIGDEGLLEEIASITQL